MQLLTCPVCGETNEIDDEELAIGQSIGVLLCATCESPLFDEGEGTEHAMDDDEQPVGDYQRPGQPVTAELVEELTFAVQALTDQVRCLRLAIDEIEAELGWAIRTRVLPQLQPPSFTTLQTSPSEAERVTSGPLRSPSLASNSGEAARQPSLW
jgi:hypothetical protein